MAVQNVINQNYFTSQGGFNLPNMTFPAGMYSTTTTGDLDLYTVPANRRALIYSCQTLCSVFNSSSIVTPELKNSGTYYALAVPRTYAALSTTGPQNTLISALILEAGETFSVNVNVANTYTHVLGMVEFDNTANIRSVKTFNVGSGDTLIYTCPAGKTAMSIDSNCAIGSGGFWVTQQNTTSFTYYASIVPNGQVLSATYRAINNFTITGSLSPVGSGITAFPPYVSLAAGDTIYLNSTSAGANAIINVIEI